MNTATTDYLAKIPRVDGMITDHFGFRRPSEPIERPDPAFFYAVRWDVDGSGYGHRNTITGAPSQRDSLFAESDGSFGVFLASSPLDSDTPDAQGQVVACGTPEEWMREAMWAAEAALAELDGLALAQEDRFHALMTEAFRFAGPATIDTDRAVVENVVQAMKSGESTVVRQTAEHAVDLVRTLRDEAFHVGGDSAIRKRAVSTFYEMVSACCGEWLSTH